MVNAHRHDWVSLRSEAQPAVQCATSDQAATRLKSHLAAARPLVWARQRRDEPEASCRLGFVFMDDGHKHRVSVLVTPGDIAHIASPYRLRDCLDAFDSPTATVLQALDQALVAIGSTAHVYGSLAWEIATGQRYRTAESDLDLLCDVADLAQAQAAVAAVQQAQTQLALRLDGELRFGESSFPDAACVNWRELAAVLDNPALPVLVKTDQQVGLRQLDALIADGEAVCV